MMRLTFDRASFVSRMQTGFSYLFTGFVPALLILIVSNSLTPLFAKTSTDPMAFKSAYDLAVILIWFISPLVVLGVTWFLRHKMPLLKGFSVLPLSMFLASLIPLFIPHGRSARDVAAAVSNTGFFYAATFSLLIIGWIVALFLSRKTLVKSNWIALLLALPSIWWGYSVKSVSDGFYQFLQSSDFSNRNVARMIGQLKASDIRLINPTWYNTIGLVIIFALLYLGVILGALIWTQTQGWRGKARQIKKEDQQEGVR